MYTAIITVYFDTRADPGNNLGYKNAVGTLFLNVSIMVKYFLVMIIIFKGHKDVSNNIIFTQN